LVDFQPLTVLHTLELQLLQKDLCFGIENGQEVAENLATKGGINEATMFVPTWRTRRKQSVTNGRAHESIEIALIGAVRRVQYLLHAVRIVDVEETTGAHPGDERRFKLSRQTIHVLQKRW